ncbi:sugar lactone lactonase YvrE [Litoreibacter ponti]|uniref:Sugar lactone lactonase YvrE n=1 Tax=Litoreibacter ponti TaxID=1510457 RepID=A0A2T6BFN3_9RHOB|nr:SMP-30/gluconolactonase/LRE family protein [Litoreibacter ponti]PTX54857.1 sugar lactone lactonase YvrE [Litoreibacter ponti]
MSWKVHDDRACVLGEGAFWHPGLGKLFWCDIMGRRLLCDEGRVWYFEEHISALGWVNDRLLFVASETGLATFNLQSEVWFPICSLEADEPKTRSNDGRADPKGGFWIGTMGKNAEPDAGAIYRFHKGELRQLFAPITIPNAICFSPDGAFAFFADTYFGRVMRVALDRDGWPCAPPIKYLDLAAEGLNPDGAIITAEGDMLLAQWGAGRVAQYGPDGSFKAAFDLPTSHITCPALGGSNFSTLFATSALQGLSEATAADQPHAGCTFAIETSLTGLPAPKVLL